MRRRQAICSAGRLQVVALLLIAAACGGHAAGEMSTSGNVGYVGADASTDANSPFRDAAVSEASVTSPPSGSAACAAIGGQCVTSGNCANTDNLVCDPGVGSCCLDQAICPDGGPNFISGSNYDQSCTTDFDCLEVSGGDACYVCIITCGAEPIVINRSSYPRYMADVSRTLAAAAQPGVGCGCPGGASPSPGPAGPFCRGGTCTTDRASPDAATE